jgi:hypothetical protein
VFDKQKFTITEEHLKLARRMCVGWDGGEFGAPAIDCKRPYGNSDAYGDIAEILGMTAPDREEDEEWRDEEMKRMDAIHKEMATVLQIGLRTGKFDVGTYECEKYSADWKAV